MFVETIHSSWQDFFDAESQKEYFTSLMISVEEEYRNHVCFPSRELLFNAFKHCGFDDLKVVIIGQDPYHGVGEANGLCFSVNDGVPIPPSLRNIFREINDEFGHVFFSVSGNLERWADQGVLLLNASLSVRKDMANSHKHLKWNVFTDAVIKKISDEKENVVFLLWGGFAHKKGLKIDRNKHLVLQTGHPSPLSANQGKWFGNQHFSKTNAFLKEKGKTEIVW